MKLIFFLFLFLTIQLQSFSQESKVVITVLEKLDRTFMKNDSLHLETWGTMNKIEFVNNGSDECLITKGYHSDKFRSVWNGDTTIEKSVKSKFLKFKNKISFTEYVSFKNQFEIDLDSSNSGILFTHTSHHYLNFYISIISENDTTIFRKSKPFDSVTPWWCQESGRIISNLKIDLFIYQLLPKKFLHREKLRIIS